VVAELQCWKRSVFRKVRSELRKKKEWGKIVDIRETKSAVKAGMKIGEEKEKHNSRVRATN